MEGFKFKVGDTVILVKMDMELNFYSEYLGETGTVVNINELYAIVKFRDDTLLPYVENLEKWVEV